MSKAKEQIRCFIALEISREAIKEIEEIQKLIKNKNLFYGKFTEPENLHLTLKFLGKLDENQVEKIKNKLKDIKIKKFEVSMGELGLFSDKILWLKLQGKEIWTLQEQIDKKIEELNIGFKKEERFMSHITIARIKKAIDRKILSGYIKNIKPREIEFQVKEFILKKSELKPEGPVYRDLENYKLE